MARYMDAWHLGQGRNENTRSGTGFRKVME